MRYGYARVSTEDQNLDLQVAALNQANCLKIYTDQGVSGALHSRPGLDKLIRRLKPGDTLVVWRLDRLGRSLRYLVDLIDLFGKKDIHFVSLMENIDTTSSGGRLLFHMMAALAEFERSLISERTKAGMAAARAAGKHVGRKPSLNCTQRAAIKIAIANDISLDILAKQYSVHPRTLQRFLSKSSNDALPST
ncbi:recombinase family protein [Paenalcaligenes niemegkensis]|uniref:recombinase family protein n=1 Tax=Paenalcaligenes niemegkensis TaxID=2895469 RepID=UPI001EE7E318|nr:recombinase family protein [Paenalcaligenes niemegkensis]